MCVHVLSCCQAVLYKTCCYSYGWKILKQTLGGVFIRVSFFKDYQRLPPPSSSLFFTVAQLTAAAPTHKHKNINLLIYHWCSEKSWELRNELEEDKSFVSGNQWYIWLKDKAESKVTLLSTALTALQLPHSPLIKCNINNSRVTPESAKYFCGLLYYVCIVVKW